MKHYFFISIFISTFSLFPACSQLIVEVDVASDSVKPADTPDHLLYVYSTKEMLEKTGGEIMPLLELMVQQAVCDVCSEIAKSCSDGSHGRTPPPGGSPYRARADSLKCISWSIQDPESTDEWDEESGSSEDFIKASQASWLKLIRENPKNFPLLFPAYAAKSDVLFVRVCLQVEVAG